MVKFARMTSFVAAVALNDWTNAWPLYVMAVDKVMTAAALPLPELIAV